MNIYMIRIEALLFAYGGGISYSKLAEILDISRQKIKENVKLLKEHYNRLSNALEIVEYEDKVQIAIRSEFMSDVEKLYADDKQYKLSKSALEVLSIIAYNPYITKASIEHLRGVNSERVISVLMEEGFVKAIKAPENIRLKQYITTDKFLKKFGLKNLKELPDIEEMGKLQMKLGEIKC